MHASTLVAALSSIAFSLSVSAQCLDTTYVGGNGLHGAMFDVRALNDLTIEAFDTHLAPHVDGYDLEVYAVTGGGTYVGNQSNPAAWTLIGSVTDVISAGGGTATPIPIAVGWPMLANDVQGFYVVISGAVFSGHLMAYTNGTAAGNLFASDANLEFFEGAGSGYPFGGSPSPRIWNGTIRYSSFGSTPCALATNYGDGCGGLTLSSTLPTLASSVDVMTNNLPVGTLAGVLAAGFTTLEPGVDLTSNGAPGCYLNLVSVVSLSWFPTAPSASIALPNNPALYGQTFAVQSAALVPGINALNLVTSHGMKFTIGL